MTPEQLAAVLTAAGWSAYVPVALAVVGVCAKLAAVLPRATPQSPVAWRIARAVLDVVGGNWGNAANVVPAAAPVILPAANDAGASARSSG